MKNAGAPVPGSDRQGIAVAVHVLVAAPRRAQLAHLRLVEHLAAIDRLVRIRERLRHPGVHAEVEIAHHEDDRLQPLGQVERVHRHLVALFDRRRQQQHVPRVAVRVERREEDVALRRARRQTRGRPDALDVEHDRRHLGVVRRGRRTRTSARCPGPDVDVIARAPAQLAPTTMPSAAISSSACTIANVALPVSLSMRYFRM